MLLLLKKEKQEIFLWLKMSFQREKQSWDNLIFMYEMTLGESLLFIVFLEKVIQLGWLRASTNYFSFLFVKLGMEQIKDMFCKKILIFLIIMLECCSWLSKSIVSWYLGILDISSHAILYWSDASRISIC